MALDSAASLTKSVALAESLLSQVIDVPTALALAQAEEAKQVQLNSRVQSGHNLEESSMLSTLSAARNLVILKSWP